MTFLEAVNRVLRLEGVIMGDDDALASFADSQHAATSTMAQLSIQAQLADLIADGFIPFEDSSATITTVASTRTYTLATDFLRMQENFLEQESSGSASGTRVGLYPGGEKQLRKDDATYREITSLPIYFYPVGGTTKKLALYPVPNSVLTYRYYYEADVSVSVTSSTVPFASEIECQTFVRMAARHFKYLKASATTREQLFPQGVEKDPVILHCRSTLMELMNPLPVRAKYGRRYA